MMAFLSIILRYDPTGVDLEGGILGLVKGYFGCVEAQGRGTLHCHMLVWIEGALNPSQIRKRIQEAGDTEFCARLISMLDNTISTEVPPDPGWEVRTAAEQYHPCAVRGPLLNQDKDVLDKERQKDLHLLAEACQRHVHTETCWKYCRDGQPRECRFNLDASNRRPETTFDMETGELHLRCLDGLVNGYNPLILEAVRCNMDIKFIGSGPKAKAVLYYITDYITKSPLKVHVAYAALRWAVRQMEALEGEGSTGLVRSKRMLQKCAHSMIANQELSAAQVAAYMSGNGDHYTSHEFRILYWTGIEQHIEQQLPSPDPWQCAWQP
ncbi:hypothetical protein CALVIDRAFT_545813 [Calocera viscosa TUFC12733]|uniref:Helitron helicase-like domain-containing protein n=1 Tax=Calocera viscosa (strain TUFC12733) TaxID=1330018 RepID=A0A167LN43_CALVF|nr:hypothetical protein CALVIDRAFT_545813 [Calocera viscosa TUFC12733]